MDNPPRKITSANMLVWSKCLESIPQKGKATEELILAFRSPRFEGWDNLRILGLPTESRSILPLADFMNDPQASLPKNSACDWFVILEPKNPNLKRYRNLGLRIEEIIPFVQQTVSDHGLRPDDYTLAMVEYRPQAFGGNILIDSDGNVLAEFCAGDQGAIAEGRHETRSNGRLFSVQSDPFTHVLRYSWVDGEETERLPLRELFHQTLAGIPHEGEGTRIRYRPGYYEFKLNRMPNGRIEPVFIDCRTDPILTLTSPHPISETSF